MNKFDQYIDFVKKNPDKTCKWVKLAVDRFEKDLKRKDLVWDYKEGHRAVKFFETILRHWEGDKAGQKLELEPHQHFYIIQKFGWYYKNGKRRFTTCYKSVARKNGKTTEEAGQGLFVMMFSGEMGAQVYAAATKEEQARIVVNDAGQIVTVSDDITSRFDLYKGRGTYTKVVYPEKKALFQSLGGDSKTQDGFNPLMGIIDEYHAHPDNDMVNILRSGQGARMSDWRYLIDIITTAGFNKGVCYNFEENLKEVLEGKKEQDNLLGIIYTLDEGDDWQDTKNFIKANPNLGVSVGLDYMQDRLTEAINEGGTKEVDFKTKNLNIWTDAEKVWIQDEVWMKNTRGKSVHELEGQVCWGGLDLAKGIDLNAFVLLFEDMSFLPFFWIPEEKLNNNRDGVDYHRWAQKGLITLTEGNIVDHRRMAYDILEILQKYDLRNICYDRYLAHHGLIQILVDEGIECVPLGQGYASISTPTKELEKLATSGKMEHFNNEVMRWMMGNITIDMDPAGNIKPNKSKSQNKIDGIAALINAIGAYLMAEPENEVIISLI